MDITATTMAKKLGIPYQRMVDILQCTDMKENNAFGFWGEKMVFPKDRKGRRGEKLVECFLYNYEFVKCELSALMIYCGQVSKRSKKTKRFLIRNYGI